MRIRFDLCTLCSAESSRPCCKFPGVVAFMLEYWCADRSDGAARDLEDGLLSHEKRRAESNCGRVPEFEVCLHRRLRDQHALHAACCPAEAEPEALDKRRVFHFFAIHARRLAPSLASQLHCRYLGSTHCQYFGPRLCVFQSVGLRFIYLLYFQCHLLVDTIPCFLHRCSLET